MVTPSNHRIHCRSLLPLLVAGAFSFFICLSGCGSPGEETRAKDEENSWTRVRPETAGAEIEVLRGVLRRRSAESYRLEPARADALEGVIRGEEAAALAPWQDLLVDLRVIELGILETEPPRRDLRVLAVRAVR